MVIPPTFGTASRFAEGLARAGMDGGYKSKQGYIDQTGRFAIEAQFVGAREFSSGLARITFGDKQIPGNYGKWGFIDKAGRQVISAIFDDAEDFAEELALVAIGGKHGFINRSGVFVIEPVYGYAESFSDGVALVAVSRTLREILPTTNLPDEYASTEQLVFGYINHDGSFRIEPQFSKATSFSGGVAAARPFRAGWRLIHKDGGTICELPSCNTVGRFSEGLADVGVVSNRQTRFGFIDVTGRFVIEPKYDTVRPFSEGMAAVGEFVKSDRSYRMGFIGSDGEVIVRPEYIEVSDFRDGLAEVQSRGTERWSTKRGYIDRTGAYVWEPTEPPTRTSNNTSDGIRQPADGLPKPSR
jgi:hypothetical protein